MHDFMHRGGKPEQPEETHVHTEKAMTNLGIEHSIFPLRRKQSANHYSHAPMTTRRNM